MFSEGREGWLGVLVGTNGNSAWTKHFCVVFPKENLLRFFVDEEEYVRYIHLLTTNGRTKPLPRSQNMDGERPDSARRLRRSRNSISSTSDLENGSAPTSPTRKFRARTRNSISCASELENALTPVSAASKLSEFSRRIAGGIRFNQRSKSLSSASSTCSVPTSEDSGFSEHGNKLAASRSHESLLVEKEKAPTMDSVDLSICGKVTVRPIHPSILSKQYCFQVVTAHETKFFSCRSTEDLNKWIISIKKSIQPTRDHQYRTDIALSVWILEAKGLSSKLRKKYFCELLFDKVLYARTSSKTKTDILFWGENFAFGDLVDVEKIGFNIYEEEAKSKKDKKKLVGSAEVSVSGLECGQEVEKWHPITLVGTKGTGVEGPSMRLKLKYQKVSILPLGYYKDLLEYLKTNYMTVCETLEPVVSVRSKDDIAQVLLRILQACGMAKEFLINIVLAEVNTLEDENLVFRGNSFATKAMDTYMKMIGETYLQDTLGDFVRSIYDFEEDCEVDPTRAASGNVEANQANLSSFVEKAWNHILCSSHNFPSDLQETFYELRRKCSAEGQNLSMKLISASIFLRFFCPAILSPSLFHLVQEFPDERTSRMLTLIAKVMQNLANLTRFLGKEDYMAFMNDFVEREFHNMKQFLNLISSCPDVTVTQKDDCIDLGRELAVMFNILTDQLSKLNQEGVEKLKPLQLILKSIQEAYHNLERQLVDAAQEPRRWASSSDIISEQEKERSSITLSPMSEIGGGRLGNPQAAQLPVSSLVHRRAKTPRRGRTLPTPDSSRIRVLNPDFGIDPRRFSTPITLYPSDLEFLDVQRTLRRNSYLNAMSDGDGDMCQNGQRTKKQFLVQTPYGSETRSRSRSFGSGAVQSNSSSVNYCERELSSSQGNLTESNEFSETITGGNPHIHRPGTPVITDHSRSTSPRLSSSRPASPRPSSLEIIDSIVNQNEKLASPQSPSPTSSPRFVRKQYSPRLLRVKTTSFPVKQITRSFSETSSSSSESGGSNQPTKMSSWASGTYSWPNGRRAHKLPPTPSVVYDHQSRDSSPHSSGSEKLPSKVEEDLRGEESVRRPRTLAEYEAENQELLRELKETKRVLSSTHEQLILQESSTHKLIASFKERLVDSEQRLRRLQEEKEQEVREVMGKLFDTEAELIKEQKQTREITEAKQKVIESQGKRIRGLETSNSRLLAALQQVKNDYSRSNNDVYNDVDCNTV